MLFKLITPPLPPRGRLPSLQCFNLLLVLCGLCYGFRIQTILFILAASEALFRFQGYYKLGFRFVYVHSGH